MTYPQPFPHPVVQQPAITAGAYSANDAVGGLLTFNFGRGKRMANVNSIEVVETDASPVEAALDLYLFNDPALAKADNAAFSISEANALLGKFIAKVSFTADDYVARLDTAGSAARKDGLNLYLPLFNGIVYGQLVCTGTPTYAAVDDLYVTMFPVEYA